LVNHFIFVTILIPGQKRGIGSRLFFPVSFINMCNSGRNFILKLHYFSDLPYNAFPHFYSELETWFR